MSVGKIFSPPVDCRETTVKTSYLTRLLISVIIDSYHELPCFVDFQLIDFSHSGMEMGSRSYALSLLCLTLLDIAIIRVIGSRK